MESSDSAGMPIPGCPIPRPSTTSMPSMQVEDAAQKSDEAYVHVGCERARREWLRLQGEADAAAQAYVARCEMAKGQNGKGKMANDRALYPAPSAPRPDDPPVDVQDSGKSGGKDGGESGGKGKDGGESGGILRLGTWCVSEVSSTEMDIDN